MPKKKRDPKKGTGKKPKGLTGRRLYTDENPKDTVKIKFATPAMLEQQLLKLKRLKNLLLEKYKYLPLVSKELKSWVKHK